MHRVVILGGGFGGLYAARSLRHAPVDVTLVDRRNFHLFQPLLYQVATGTLAPGEIASPLRVLLRKQHNARVLLGEAVSLNADTRRLILADGEVPYDSLIVAPGARNHYFGHGEWRVTAPGLKSIEDADRIRHKILYAFEAAEREPDEQRRRAWLTFVVAGGGATGVELAGAIAEISRDMLRGEFRLIRPEESRILLLDGGPRVLAAYSEALSQSAERQLVNMGVRPLLNAIVTAVEADHVRYKTKSGEGEIPTRTVLWAAGVAPSEFASVLEKEAGAELTRKGQVRVAADLSLPNHPEIFVVGDLAYLEQDGHPLPGVAPVAMQEGRYAARVIADRVRGRQTRPFRFSDRGMLAVIGRNAGVGTIGKAPLTGRLAWLAWLFIHLFFLTEAFNRVLVFLKWGYNYITYDRGSRLITGDPGGGPTLDK